MQLNVRLEMEKRMQLSSTHIINAPAGAVWSLMGERFADIGEWSETVESSSLDGPLQVGSTRTCKLKPTPAGLDTIQETLTAFDHQRQHFAFDIVTGLPSFMARVSSAWTIEELDSERTRARNELSIEVKWWMRPMLPLIGRQFQKTIKLFIAEIEAAARGPMEVVEARAMAV